MDLLKLRLTINNLLFHAAKDKKALLYPEQMLLVSKCAENDCELFYSIQRKHSCLNAMMND